MLQIQQVFEKNCQFFLNLEKPPNFDTWIQVGSKKFMRMFKNISFIFGY